MAPEVQTVESVATSGTDILESMTGDERKDWQATGKVPERPKEVPATSAPPALVAKPEPDKETAETKPASEPGKAAQEPEREKSASRGDRRILELLGKNKELQAEIEELRRPKAEVKAEAKPEPAPGKPASPVVISDALKAKIVALVGNASEFETYEDLVAALGVEIVQTMVPDLVKQALTQQEEARQVEKVQQKVTEGWMKSVNEAAGKHSDYEVVVDSPEMAKLIPIGSSLNSIIVDSELGGEILYHLGNHKDELKRISELPLIAQFREIFKLENSLSGSPAPTETEVPPPLKTLGAGEITTSNAVDAALQRKDAGAYIKAENERESRERARLRK